MKLSSLCIDLLYGLFTLVPLQAMDCNRDKKYFSLNKLREDVLKARELREANNSSPDTVLSANREILIKLLGLKLK